LVLKNYAFNKDDASNYSFSDETGKSYSSSATYSDSEKGKEPSKTSRLLKIINDPLGIPYFEEFLVHYQLLDLTNCVSFLQKIKSFKKINDKRALAGHAMLIYQKYLIANSYIHVDVFTDAQLRPTVNLVDELTKDETGNIDVETTFFDDLVAIVENVLTFRTSNSFFASHYYQNYVEKTGLEEGLKLKVISESK